MLFLNVQTQTGKFERQNAALENPIHMKNRAINISIKII